MNENNNLNQNTQTNMQQPMPNQNMNMPQQPVQAQSQQIPINQQPMNQMPIYNQQPQQMINQVQPIPQPMPNQNMNMTQQQEPQKKSKALLIIIIILLVLAILGGIGIFTYKTLIAGIDTEIPVTDENSQNEENSNTETTPVRTTISNDWKSGEFIIDEYIYKLESDYKEFMNNGWSIDFAGMGYANGYILNKGDKTYGTIEMQNSKYQDASVQIGLVNLGEEAKDATQSQYWSINVRNTFSDTPVDFTLPNGIKYGSTLAEVEAAYGKPSDPDDIYRAEDLKYTSYEYVDNYSLHLRLIIYDDGGVKEFEYKKY